MDGARSGPAEPDAKEEPFDKNKAKEARSAAAAPVRPRAWRECPRARGGRREGCVAAGRRAGGLSTCRTMAVKSRSIEDAGRPAGRRGDSVSDSPRLLAGPSAAARSFSAGGESGLARRKRLFEGAVRGPSPMPAAGRPSGVAAGFFHRGCAAAAAGRRRPRRRATRRRRARPLRAGREGTWLPMINTVDSNCHWGLRLKPFKLFLSSCKILIVIDSDDHGASRQAGR